MKHFSKKKKEAQNETYFVLEVFFRNNMLIFQGAEISLLNAKK
jgi:hypothetical protein